MKQIIVVSGSAGSSARRLETARHNKHGIEVRTIEQVAVRLAGGFLQPIDAGTLVQATTDAIRSTPPEALGDLASIIDLPGLPTALATTLTKTWQANIDLAQRAAEHSSVQRLATLAHLEQAVLDRLPPSMLRPADLVARATERIHLAKAILGEIEIGYLIDVAPCWRPLLLLLRKQQKLVWRAGAHPVPAWWEQAAGDKVVEEVATPDIKAVTCATARHEVIEAMRWARGLLASGNAQAQDIAFAAASPGEYDDLILAMSQEANLDIHFGHGRRALASRDGQAAAALADILLSGLSQDRVRRLARLAHDPATPFGRLPDDWTRALPPGAPLGSPARWRQATLQAGAEINDILLPAIDLLTEGTAKAAEAGETFLRGTARLLWRRALLQAPASALEGSLGALRLPDIVEPGAAIAWLNAAALACSPRPYVWLFGLNARVWPRASSEDPLLPNHIVPTAELEPLPVTKADRLAFHAIRDSTARQLVCCASRRDATGRLLGLSPLMPAGIEPERLRRARIPEHAMSEADRLMARPAEFAGTLRAASAHGCWQDWNNPAVTAHDGLVRPDHPMLARELARVHSATSLKLLLRNPLGFTWHYALRWREPDMATETMSLDALQFGGLVHGMLDAALPSIEAAGGLGRATPAGLAAAIRQARIAVAAQWEAEQPIPPAILWALKLDEAEEMALTALSWPLETFPGQRSHSELPFGDPDAETPVAAWDNRQAVTIPGTGLQIRGFIDRLDLSGDGQRARVVDYKTGRPQNPGVLNGGGELQRCLYAYAVQALLGTDVHVEAALLYPRGEDAVYHPLVDTEAALRTLTNALLRARDSLQAGRALFGPDTGGTWDDLRFALPASPGAMTDRKREAARALLGDAALIWDEA